MDKNKEYNKIKKLVIYLFYINDPNIIGTNHTIGNKQSIIDIKLRDFDLKLYKNKIN